MVYCKVKLPTIMDKSLGTNLHFRRFCTYARREYNFTCLTSLFLFYLSAQSRDDLEASFSHKKSKKDRGFFSLFRSASDTDLNIDDKKNGVCGKKHKDKYSPNGEVMGNGVHHVGKETKEKGDTEETKERKEKRRSEKSEERTEKKEKTSKKNREDEKEKIEKKEKRKEKEKEKKVSRRDENDGSESDCTICQEKRRKSREKSRSKESRHKEQRSKSEHRRTKDYKETEYDKDRKDEEKEHKKKKHHKDKERDKEHKDKDRERDHRDKDRSRRDKNHRRKTEEQEVSEQALLYAAFLMLSKLLNSG